MRVIDTTDSVLVCVDFGLSLYCYCLIYLFIFIGWLCRPRPCTLVCLFLGTRYSDVLAYRILGCLVLFHSVLLVVYVYVFD
jgi:hypothetical protein